MTLAKMYFLSGNAASGRGSLEKTALEIPGDPEAYLILAEQAVQQGRFIEAESLYDKSLQIIEKFSENQKRKRKFQIGARAGRASVYERRKDWTAAGADLAGAAEGRSRECCGPLSPRPRTFMQKKFREGYDEFVAASKIDKNLPNPDVSASLMYEQLSQDDPKCGNRLRSFSIGR